MDIIFRNESGKFLLLRRNNEPLKNKWWVVGGRIKTGEAAQNACIRKAFEELGIEINKPKFLGYYEDVFDKNSFEDNRTYHTISLVFEAKIKAKQVFKLDDQHLEWKWFDKLPTRFAISTQNLINSKMDEK